MGPVCSGVDELVLKMGRSVMESGSGTGCGEMTAAEGIHVVAVVTASW